MHIQLKYKQKKNHFLANNEDSAGWEVIFLKIAYVIHFEINQWTSFKFEMKSFHEFITSFTPPVKC